MPVDRCEDCGHLWSDHDYAGCDALLRDDIRYCDCPNDSRPHEDEQGED